MSNQYAWNIQHILLGTVGRTSKLALDAALIAYYGESAALTRRIVDSWANAAYLRYRPQEALRWRAAPDRRGSASVPSMKSILATLRRQGEEESHVALAETLFGLASKGSHSSAEFLNQAVLDAARDPQKRNLKYVPVFHPAYSQRVIEWGVIALLLAVREYALLELQPDQWHVGFRSILDEVRERQRMQP